MHHRRSDMLCTAVSMLKVVPKSSTARNLREHRTRMSRPRRYVRRPAAGTTGGGMDGIPAGAGSTSAVAPGVGGAGVDRKCGRPGGALGVSTATCARGRQGP